MSRRAIDINYPLNVGNTVVIDRNGNQQEGVIKFMGKTDFKKEYDGIWLGIEVTDGSAGKNSGDFEGEKYFDCPPGKGVFVIRKRVRFIVEEDDPNLDTQSKGVTGILGGSAYRGRQRIPSEDLDDEPPPPPTTMHPGDIPPPPPKKSEKDKHTKQITVTRGDENVTHNPLHSFNKPRYFAARQKEETNVEATNLFRGDIETLAKVEKIKLSDLDRYGTGQVNIDELQDVMDKLNKYKYRRQMYINLCKGICVGILFLMILLVGSMVIGHELTKPVAINQSGALTDRHGQVLGTETMDSPLDPNFQSFAATDKIEGFFGKYYVNAEVAMVIQTQLNVYRFLTHQTNMEFILDRRQNQDNLTLAIENRDGTISYIPGRAPVGTANLTVPEEFGAEEGYNGTFNGSDVNAIGFPTRRRLQSTNFGGDAQPVSFLNSRKWAAVPEAGPNALNAVAYHIVCWSYNRDVAAAKTTPRVGPGVELGTQPSMNSPFAWRLTFSLAPQVAIDNVYQSNDNIYIGSLWKQSADPRTSAVTPLVGVFLRFRLVGSPPSPIGDIVIMTQTDVQEYVTFASAWDPATKATAGQQTKIELVFKSKTEYLLFIDGNPPASSPGHTANNNNFTFENMALTVFSGGDPNTLGAPGLANFPTSANLEVYDVELDCQTSIVADDLWVWIPQKMTFFDANNYCRDNYRSSLPSLKTQQENAAFAAWFHQKAETTDYTWIGATQDPTLTESQDSVSSGKGWFWVDGTGTVKTHAQTGVPNNYANWNAPAGRGPEPNEYFGNAAIGENCAAMYGKYVSGSGKWLDTPCDGQTGRQTWMTQFACQKRSQSCYVLRDMVRFPSRSDPTTYSCFFNPNPNYALSDLQRMCATSQTDAAIAAGKSSKRCVGVSYTTGKQTGGVGCLYFFHLGWDATSSWQQEGQNTTYSMFLENLCAGSAQPSPAPTNFPSTTPSTQPSRSPSTSPSISPTQSPTFFNTSFSKTKVVVSGIQFRMTFFQANDYCRKIYGGYLFQPRTLADNAFASSMLHETFKGTAQTNNFFMGMRSNRPLSFDYIIPAPPSFRQTTRLELRRKFTWTTDTTYNVADSVDCNGACYRAWEGTQPDGWTLARLAGVTSTAGDRDVSCGIYQWTSTGSLHTGGNKYSWFDEDCGKKHDFICEVDPFKKFIFVNQLMTYDRAKAYTSMVYGPNAHLAGPNDLNAKLARTLYYYSLTFGTGASAGPLSQLQWQFNNGGGLTANIQKMWMPISTQVNPTGFYQWYQDNVPNGQHYILMDTSKDQCVQVPSMSCTTQFTTNPMLAIMVNPYVTGDLGSPVSQTTQSAMFMVSASIPRTNSPSKNPSVAPTKRPSLSPTTKPTKNPSKTPTSNPSTTPSDSPATSSPTGNPVTNSPVGATTPAPATQSPSKGPTKTPSGSPVKMPSKSPTDSPTTLSPSFQPSKTPSKHPSQNPSQTPTQKPSGTPSKAPSKSPTKPPSNLPSRAPFKVPSSTPTVQPTRAPNFGFTGVQVKIQGLNNEVLVGPPMDFFFNLTGFIGDPPTCRIVDTANNNIRPLVSYTCVANPLTNIPGAYQCDCYFNSSITSGGSTDIVGARDVFPNTTCAVGKLNQAVIDGTSQEQAQPAITTISYLWDLSSETYAIFGMIYLGLFIMALIQEIRIYRGHALKRSLTVTLTHAMIVIMSFGYMTVCFVYASFTRFQASFTLATLLAVGLAGSSVWTFCALVINGVHLVYDLHWRNMGFADGKKRMIRLLVQIYGFLMTIVFVAMGMAQISDANQNAQGFQSFNILAHTSLMIVGIFHAILCGILGSLVACKVQTRPDDDDLTSAQQIDRAFSEFEEEDKPKGDSLAVRLSSVSIVFAVINLFAAIVALVMAATWPWHQFALSTARVVFLILPVLIIILWLYLYWPTVGRAIDKARLKRENAMVDLDDDTVGLEETFQGLPLEEEWQMNNEVDLKEDHGISLDEQDRRGTNMEFGAGSSGGDNTAFASARKAAGSVGTGPVLDYDNGVGMTPDGSEQKKKKRKKKKKKKNKKKKKRDRLTSGYGDTAMGEASREITEDDGDFYEGPVATAEATEYGQIPEHQQQMSGMDDMLNYGNTGSLGEDREPAGDERNRGDTEAIFGGLPTLPSEKHL